MFVIVGEVKVGKSSFINVLFDIGKEVIKVVFQFMIDIIQQIFYGEEVEQVQINFYLKKILLFVEILKEIVIVDILGINIIVEYYQEIIESFILVFDLIVFVFEVKNFYWQFVWQFFDYIYSDWCKKIIFVLQ